MGYSGAEHHPPGACGVKSTPNFSKLEISDDFKSIRGFSEPDPNRHAIKRRREEARWAWVRGVAQLAQKPRRGWVRGRERVGLSGARWVSRMRQSDAGGSGTGMEKGVVSIPAPGATSLSSTLSTVISNASIV